MARDHPKITAGLKESTSGSYDVISEPTIAKATNSSRGKLYTMEELERCLTNENERNCLQDFACNREFTGENIMFLTQVHDFQSHWYPFCNSDSELSLAAKRRMFEAALTIFAHLVCPDTASVYINIEGRIYKALNAILGDAARAHVSTANTNEFGTSISMTSLHPNNIDGISLNSGKSMAIEIITPITSDTSREELIASPKSLSHVVVDDLDIAEGFGLGIFNEAYESVKNMVYAQTWQRFNQEKDKVRRSSSNSV
ncbi:MAG: hypothetical protein LQ347_002050 [Umbilicaria vellea]|nr:MAG: hypothetical protein LQ347_002050 [Umbilicaria vellea]